MAGDFVGAGLELASGAASTVPGIGTAGSVGIDAALAARDMMTPFAEGGIVAEPTNALIGEAGKEGVFPLSGSEGKKTFIKFGEGILEAQRRNENENSKIMAKGLSEYYDKQNGWEKFIEGITDLFKKIFSSLPDWMNPFKGKKDPSPDEGTVTPTTPSVGVGASGGITRSGDLFDVIASGEGGYESINRGVAGDTPGGAESVFGKKLSDMTVGEVMELQTQDKLFAVGKYQIIPETMKGFVRTMKISLDDKFDSTTQEKFKKYVTDFKRPAVGRYLRGESNNRAEAAQELAREFASIGLAYDEAGRVRGESRYSGMAGNAASISPEEIEAALDRGRFGQTPKSNNLSPTPDDMNWYNKQMQESQSFLPSAAETGNALSITSQQVASASLAPQAAPIIQYFYGTGANQSGGNAPMTVPFGISSGDTGTPSYGQLYNQFLT